MKLQQPAPSSKQISPTLAALRARRGGQPRLPVHYRLCPHCGD